MTDRDPVLRRVGWRAVALALAAVLVAAVVPGGGWRAAASVAGGALVAAVSYWSIRRGVAGVVDAASTQGGHAGAARGIISLVVRYALLAVMAYVMIARLRLAPIGLLIGASVIPASAAIEFVRRRT